MDGTFPCMYNYLIGTKFKIVFLYLIAYILLWFGYAWFVVPVYGYSGFEWTPSFTKVLESFVAFVFFMAILPPAVNRPSDIFIHMHFLLPVLPMLVIYGASDLPRAYMYFVLLAFSVVCLVRNFKIPKIKGDIVPKQIMMWGLLSLAATCIFSLILKGGLQHFNLDLMKVYEFRNVAAQDLPGVFGYLSPMVEKIALPFTLALAIYHRKWLIAGLSLAGSVILFGLISHKGALFYPLFVLGIYWAANSKQRLVQLLLAGYTLVIVVSLIPFLIIGYETTESSLSGIIMGTLFLRRGYFVPSLLNFQYYDFFSTNPHVMWAQSQLSFGMVDYTYGLDSSHLIGYYYYNHIMAGANTGWLGSGYMHLGFAGMLLYALLVGLLFAVADMLAAGRQLGPSVAVLFTPFLTLFLSSDLPTACLTHGLLLGMFLTWACCLSERWGSSSHT